MILWKGKETRSDRCATRWALEVTPTSVELALTVKVKGDRAFRVGPHAYFNATLTKHFKLGSDHWWYDGPHCGFSVGFVHFNWSYWNCEKCHKQVSR